MRATTVFSSSVAALALSASIAAAQDTGIAACDTFLKSYESCIGTNVPAAQQAQMKTTLDQVRTNWKSVAADAAGKSQLEGVCRQTAEAVKQQTASLGCTW